MGEEKKKKVEQSLHKYQRNKLLSRVGYKYLYLRSCYSPRPGQGSSTPHVSVHPTGSVPALEAITSHRGDPALGLWLHSPEEPRTVSAPRSTPLLNSLFILPMGYSRPTA